MVKLDYTYVTNWTMREDLRILMRTLGAVLRGRGAY
jgi:lipopolysaccharide/colanic/teichoic acid biosynthesis glycosyltransferase